MGKVAFIFPGQGSQYVGMAKDFYEEYSECKQVFEKASKVLDFDLIKMCFEENDLINNTEYTQACMVTAEIAIYEHIKKLGFSEDVCAGLSLGEYSALVACDAMNFEDAIKVVRQRGKLMQDAVKDVDSGMSAVIGIDEDVIERVCNDIDGVGIANSNCPGQTVISGEISALEKAEEKLKQEGARRLIRLNVSGAFHSFLMKQAGIDLYEILKDIELKELSKPYVCNTYAEYVSSKDKIKEILKEQVYSGVKWTASVKTMIENGVDTFVEIGPGKTLSSFVRKINREVKCINIEKISDLDKLNELK